MPFLLLFFLFLFLWPLQAQIRILQNNTDGLQLHLSIKKPQLIATSNATQIEIPNGIEEFTPGYPMIPFYRLYVRIPNGNKMVWSIDKLRYSSNILPAPIAALRSLPIHDGKSHPVSLAKDAYRKESGKDPIVLDETGTVGPDRIAIFRWYPIRYEPIHHRFSWTQSLQLQIQFVEAKEKRAQVQGASLSYPLFLNPAPSHRPDSKAIELIIAHDSFRTALFPYLEWKQHAGREIRTFFIKGKAASEIKKIIESEYKKASPPTSTLLIGSIDQIPAWRGSGDNTWTDFDYQVLDGDKIPDLALGRIPAQNNRELITFFEKAQAREYAERNVDEIMLTSGMDSSLGCPANILQVGNRFQSHDHNFQLIKKLRTEVSSESVWEGYNGNPNLVVYDGHGNRQGMSEIPLTISNLNRISNTAFPILLDIACLNANWGSQGASSRNFAETILLAEEKGLAGILASGGSGYGHDFFKNMADLMGAARKQIQSRPLSNEIGQAIWAAKIKGNAQDRGYWNYYGDPASSIWESTY